MQVEEGAYLNLAAKKYLEGLDAQERRFAAALVYTTLENLLRIDYVLAAFHGGASGCTAISVMCCASACAN